MLAKVLSLFASGSPFAAGAFVPETTPELSAQHFQALEDAARDRLREAHRQRDVARRELADAQAATERVRAVIRAAAVAAQEAADAESREREAARAWAASGALGEQPVEISMLANVSRAARRKADDAAVTADGARQALPGLEETEHETQQQLSNADEQVRMAARDVELAVLEPQFARLERAAREWDEASREVQSLARALSGNFGQPVRDGVSVERLLTRLRGLMPQAPRADSKALILNGTDLDSESWNALGKRLLEDPVASI